MDLTVDVDELKRALHAAARTLPARPTLVAHASLNLRADEGQLWIVAGDGEVTLRQRVRAEVEDGGEVLLPAALAKLVDALPRGRVGVRLCGHHVEVTGEGTPPYRLRVVTATYPATPVAERTYAFDTRPFGDVLRLLRACADEHRRVRVTSDGDALTFTSTDRTQAAFAQVPSGASDTEVHAVVPVDVLEQAHRIGAAEVGAARDRVVWRGTNVELVCNTVADPVPDVTQLLGGLPPTKVSVDAGTLSQALRRLEVLSSTASGWVQLWWEGSRLRLEPGGTDVGDADAESVEVVGEVPQTSPSAAAPTRRLHTLVSALPGDHVTVALGGHDHPIFLMGEYGATAVLSPVRR